jgi:hypothetical protein
MFFEWIRLHETLIGYLGIFSVFTFFLTLIIVPVLVIRMPTDYFMYNKKDLKQFHRQHPFVRVLTLIIKNIFGIIFICAGLAMLILPGQGIISILIGISLVSFPKKRALECAIIQQKTVTQAINWMRLKAHKNPLELPSCAMHDLGSQEIESMQQGTDVYSQGVLKNPDEQV